MARMLRRYGRRVWWIASLVVAFAAGGLAACSGSDGDDVAAPAISSAAAGTDAAPTTGVAEQPPSPADGEADAARVTAIPLSAADLMGDWTPAGGEPSLSVLADCVGELVGSDVAVSASGPELRDANEASFTSVGLVLASISVTSTVFEDLNGEGLQTCVLERLLSSFEGEEVRVTGASVSPAGVPSLGEASGGLRFVVAFQHDAEPDVPSAFYELVWVLNGREIAGMALSTRGKAPLPAVQDELIGKLAGKIGAAPNEPVPDPASTETQTQTDAEPDDEAAVVASDLEGAVQAWYEEADPAVCGRMTDAMLDSGWGKTGDAGRQECHRNLDAAEPSEDVVVKPAKVGQRRATVNVAYAVEDGRNVDRVTFVLAGGQWLINRVQLTGFE